MAVPTAAEMERRAVALAVLEAAAAARLEAADKAWEALSDALDAAEEQCYAAMPVLEAGPEGWAPSGAWLSANYGALAGLLTDLAAEQEQCTQHLESTLYHDPSGLLPIVADALEDAGCCDEHVLAHLRSGHQHSPKCPAVTRLLTALDLAMPKHPTHADVAWALLRVCTHAAEGRPLTGQ